MQWHFILYKYKDYEMKIIKAFLSIVIFNLAHAQYITGNDLLSDLQNSNKNIVYTYWIGMVNGNIQGYEYGIWYTLDQLYKEGKINETERKKALAKLEPYQKEDFKEIFTIMEDLPVTVRLLDPPLHEFLPKLEDDNSELLETTGITQKELKNRLEQLQELNPMLGHRGSRLGITFPEIYEMQTKAILEAGLELHKEKNIKVNIEIMLPLIFSSEELKILKENILKVSKAISQKENYLPNFIVGTMIELPRAALLADKIAQEADFFSFGTNDLTQTVFGISRDDAGRFLETYIEKHIIENDPFVSLDYFGVGELIEIAKRKSRSTNKSIKLGICGEHGGDPKSIDFCNKIGLDYVSCSPYRIPIAKLAAAQATLKIKTK